mgnify:CR=1 FL=1
MDVQDERRMEGPLFDLENGSGGSFWGGQGGGRTPPKMGVEIRGFFGGQKMVKNGQKRCGTEG